MARPACGPFFGRQLTAISTSRRNKPGELLCGFEPNPRVSRGLLLRLSAAACSLASVTFERTKSLREILTLDRRRDAHDQAGLVAGVAANIVALTWLSLVAEAAIDRHAAVPDSEIVALTTLRYGPCTQAHF